MLQLHKIDLRKNSKCRVKNVPSKGTLPCTDWWHCPRALRWSRSTSATRTTPKTRTKHTTPSRRRTQPNMVSKRAKSRGSKSRGRVGVEFGFSNGGMSFGCFGIGFGVFWWVVVGFWWRMRARRSRPIAAEERLTLVRSQPLRDWIRPCFDDAWKKFWEYLYACLLCFLIMFGVGLGFLGLFSLWIFWYLKFKKIS